MHLRLGLLFYIFAAVLAFPKWRVAAETGVLVQDNSPDNECRVKGPESVISKFLSSKQASLQDFHIHGWRWHTMSLVREAERLSSMAQRFQTKPVEERHPLQQAADYVIGFNLKGLHKIEADLFFPWMKDKLTTVQDQELSEAFATVMDELEKDRKTVAKLGDSIKQNARIACDLAKNELSRSGALERIVYESAALASHARSMMERENSLLVPAIAQIVTAPEQKSFNNKVLKNLGLWDSRLHLVGMHEAVLECHNPQEREIFKQAIPSVPRLMIPRWKRNLYDQKSSILEL